MGLMTWIDRRRAVGVISGLLLVPAAHAITSDPAPPDRDYRVIIERNPFALKPPPPPATNLPAVVQPKDEILLTGITSIGSLRAYFMTKAPQGKNPEYYTLGVDEKKNGLEVLNIDTMARSVRVRNGGVETVMTFAANGVKAPATPLPNAAPGTPGNVQTATITPGAGANPTHTAPPGLPGMNTAAATGVNGRARSIPSRNSRTPPTLDPGMNMGVGQPNGFNAGGFEANQQPMRADPNAAVQDVMLMELQKRANPNVVFPPTPMPTQ
jgi:hypothetical protein